mmetsp:Transcript_5092/g.12719  ORF Transcript_5092/g.12719 Transcript_5092/m.12719 type:complete len:84 (+) Transcript_5092:365-616(+)
MKRFPAVRDFAVNHASSYGSKIRFVRGSPKLTFLSKSGEVLEEVVLNGQQNVVQLLAEYGVQPSKVSSHPGSPQAQHRSRRKR